MKTSDLRWLAIGLIVVVVILSVTWWKTSAHRQVIPSQATSGELTPDVSGARANPAASPNRAALPVSDEEMGARLAMEREQVDKIVEAGRNKLFAQYQSERVDGRWALAKEQTLTRLSTSAQIEALNARPKTIDVHCRSSVCRISADFPNRLAAEDWFTLYTTNVGNELPNASLQQTANPDGTMHVEIYGLARN